jgi:hypothetical protein
MSSEQQERRRWLSGVEGNMAVCALNIYNRNDEIYVHPSTTTKMTYRIHRKHGLRLELLLVRRLKR